MTKTDFTNQIITLRKAFPGKIDVAKGNVDVWYKFLGFFDADVFEYAVNDWIMHERLAPAISELRKYAFEAKAKKTVHPEQWDWEIKHQWESMQK